jgi:hypothetical protein
VLFGLDDDRRSRLTVNLRRRRETPKSGIIQGGDPHLFDPMQGCPVTIEPDRRFVKRGDDERSAPDLIARFDRG